MKRAKIYIDELFCEVLTEDPDGYHFKDWKNFLLRQTNISYSLKRLDILSKMPWCFQWNTKAFFHSMEINFSSLAHHRHTYWYSSTWSADSCSWKNCHKRLNYLRKKMKKFFEKLMKNFKNFFIFWGAIQNQGSSLLVIDFQQLWRWWISENIHRFT